MITRRKFIKASTLLSLAITSCVKDDLQLHRNKEYDFLLASPTDIIKLLKNGSKITIIESESTLRRNPKKKFKEVSFYANMKNTKNKNLIKRRNIKINKCGYLFLDEAGTSNFTQNERFHIKNLENNICAFITSKSLQITHIEKEIAAYIINIKDLNKSNFKIRKISYS